MKLGILFILTFLSLPVWAQSQKVLLTWPDQKQLSGELIHEYEARWFWETTSNKWLAFLADGEPIDKLMMIEKSQLEKIEILGEMESRFLSDLESRGATLQRLPLEGPVYVSTGHSGHHLLENMYGDFAWDLEVQRKGKAFAHSAHQSENYFVWGKGVYAPVDGVIADLHSQAPDRPADPTLTSDLSKAGDGNFILIRIGGGYFVSLLHLQHNSIPSDLKVGDPVRVGDFLGRVGNSGITYVPHLHMTTYFYSKPLGRMISVPNYFSNLKVKTGGFYQELEKTRPKTGDFIRNHSPAESCY